MNLCQGFLVFFKVLFLKMWISVPIVSMDIQPDAIPMSLHFLGIFPLPKMKWFSVILFNLFQWEFQSIVFPLWRKLNNQKKILLCF